MTGRYRPYPEYKDSRVDFLGSIPVDWCVQRVKFLFSIGRGRVISQEELVGDGKYPVYSSQTLSNGCLGYINTYDFHCKQITWTTDGANAGTVFLRDGKHNCTNVCGTLQPKDGGNFIEYLLYCLQHVTQFYKRPDTNGAKIMNGEMGEIFLTLPSMWEQKNVTHFLDHETAKIDTLIDKQQQLIALLKEKRQAVISHAVTKGLNPDVPMKDSGVEWLGEVPEHWRVNRFSHCASIRNGQVDPRIMPYNGYTLIAPNHIESGTGKLLYTETAIEQGADSGKYLCKKGEVLYSKIRPGLAKVCISPGDETICSADMYPIQGQFGLTNGFMFWTLLSTWFTNFVVLESDRVAMPKINREKLSEVKLPIPPEDEQVQICSNIEEKTSVVDHLIKKAVISIRLAQERRTALISAAVTGKIDVRNWQPPIETQADKDTP